MITTIPTKIGKRAGALTKQREVACPTCHAPIGAFCISVGQHGSTAGNIMPTSCHNARIIAAGLTPRISNRKPKPAPTNPKWAKGQKISRALKLSWAKRKREEAEAGPHKVPTKTKQSRSEAMKASWARKRKAVESVDSSVSLLKAQSQSPITLLKLVGSVLDTLETGAAKVSVSLEGVGLVRGETQGDQFWLTIMKG